MDKWRPRLDITHLKGQTTSFHAILIVDTTHSSTGQTPWSEFLDLKKSGLFCFITPELEMLRINGGHGWIWHIREVELHPSTMF